MFKSFRIVVIIVFGLNSPNLFAQHYVFYLHGRIVEVQGANAIETNMGYGAYKYQDIIDSLKKNQFEVISEVRPNNTEVENYATKIAAQINDLLKKGIAPQNITVLGASKGALIAMLVSSTIKQNNINFIFLAACNENTFEKYSSLNFYGNILSIYEKSDSNKSCQKFKDRSTGVNHYKEIEMNTGLRHGFLYKPLPEWLTPSIKWINGNYL